MKKMMMLGLIALVPLESLAVRCSDFNTQAEAQAHMQRYHTYNLDRDQDGQACECLPGGSKYGSSKCKKY